MPDYLVPFPQALAAEVAKSDFKAAQILLSGSLQMAENCFGLQYKLIREMEEKLSAGKRYHKGAALYNWGITALFQDTDPKVSEGWRRILLAFIEDLLDHDDAEAAKQLPAYTLLTRNPAIAKDLLDLVESQVKRRVESGRIPRDPRLILKPVSEQARRAVKEPSGIGIDDVKEYVMSRLEETYQPKEKRVFIGGNYRNIAVLRFIERTVRDYSYLPVMPIHLSEQQISDNLIREISMVMLSQCAFAIFEVTIENGHLMEIERSRDFKNLKIRLVHQTMRPGDPPKSTKMLKDLDQFGYCNFTQLVALIGEFLPNA